MTAARIIQLVLLLVGAMLLVHAFVIWRRRGEFPSGRFALASVLCGASALIGALS